MEFDPEDLTLDWRPRAPLTPRMPCRIVQRPPRGAAVRGARSDASSTLVRIDLHCHSTYSVELVPALPRLRFYPLLTPQQIYRLAKSRGMDYVTITDHDTIDGCKAFLDQHGDVPDFIVGEEVSTTFPSDGMVIHINVYDHTEAEHREIQRLAGNVLELVPYLRSINRLFVLNHPTWNKFDLPTTPRRIEEYLELFDVIEGINGARPYAHNAWVWSLAQGSEFRVQSSRRRGSPPVLVAGSDSHSDAVGTTCTITQGRDRRSVLANIRTGRVAIRGAMGSSATMLVETRKLIEANLAYRLSLTDSRLRHAAWKLAATSGRLVARLMVQRYYRRQDALLSQLERIIQTAPHDPTAQLALPEYHPERITGLAELHAA
ncbi:MAG TPA: PHP domain-containing protein [Phycisphaerae bacterium]